jgi:hypothetical protein
VAKTELASTKSELQALSKRAQNGDVTALPEIRELLKDSEAVDRLGGDLARQAQLILIRKFSGKNLLYQEAVPRKLEAMRAELSGPTPTPLERLLVDRVLSCWLHLHHLEIVYAQNGTMSLSQATYYERSISAAQKRYLHAIKTLALVRKHAIPVLQVNIARKQVNVAGACPAPEN